MKKRLLVALVFAVVLISALSVSASAKWWDENPFKDVKSSAWYYDAVRICNENELFNGTSDTTFTPNMKMSRAMLAQVLANADGYDKSEYKGSSFSDVKASAWYASAVEWASKNGITSGTGGGKFSPEALITREQLAAMLQRYAEYKGMDVSSEATLDSFPDANKVSDWAKEGLGWAVENGVIAGADVKGTLYLNPKKNASRSECAQMLSNFLYIEPRYEINGNDLSLYTIVYPEHGLEHIPEAATYLANHIERSLGINLLVVNDTAKVSEYEILIGKTNREEKGLVTVDRGAFESDQMFICSVQGNYLVITGNDSINQGTRFAKTVKASYNAVHYFLEEEIGVEFYDDDDYDLIKYDPDPIISLEDGYLYSDEPFFDHRIFYMSGSVLGADHPKEQISQNISNYLTGNFGSYDDNYNATPCLTSEENKTTIINNILYCVEQDEYASRITLNINDSDQYCKCTTCMSMYRAYGTRGATIVNIANLAAKELNALYPGFEVQLGAYTYSAQPPTGMTLEDNITVEYITIEGCAGHSYNDPDCKLNKEMLNEMLGWYELTNGKIHFWDHSGAFVQFMTPFPDWDSQLENVQLFADYSFEESGILMNSVFGGAHPDFGKLRAYMFSLMYRDPYMSEEEFDYHLNKGLEAQYGAGWKYLRQYIDTIAELGNEKCHSFHAPASGYYNYESVAAKADELDALWEKAASLAEGTQLERLTLVRQSWIYLRQSATYKDCYVNGTEEEKAEYVAANEALYNYVTENDVLWTEAVHGHLADCDFTKGPDTWQIGG